MVRAFFSVVFMILAANALASPKTLPVADEEKGRHRLLAGFKGADPMQLFTVQKLRTYCRACHGVGSLRFIVAGSDQVVWDFLNQNRAPHAGVLWIDAIAAVLDWPGGVIPPFEQLKNPPAEDWMPRGSKRLDLDADHWEGRSVRELMLEALRQGR